MAGVRRGRAGSAAPGTDRDGRLQPGRRQHAVVGAVPEQSLIYQRSSGGRLRGFNGGVQLLRLDRMRAERSYDQWLDYVASGRDGRRLGYLGDQTLYTILGGLSWSFDGSRA